MNASLFFLFSLLYTFGVNFILGYQTKSISPDFWSGAKYQLYTLPLWFVVNLISGLAWKYGFVAFKNLTFVIAGVKIAEVASIVAVAYFLFREMPSWKTLIGFVLIIGGVILIKLK